MLSGGHPNSLGRTGEVVEAALDDRSRIDEVFACLDSADELVRMRAGDALEKVCRARPEWFASRADQVLDDMGSIEQPSVQWHVAQMLGHLRDRLSAAQERRAIGLLQQQLTQSRDWIVLNVTMDVLADRARDSSELAAWLAPELERLSHDDRKSVAKRATRRLAEAQAAARPRQPRRPPPEQKS
jgi:hypothetical protein